MGFTPREVDVVVGDSEAGPGQSFRRPRVHHHGGVDAGEGAAFEHEHLAPAALLGRGAEHADGEPELIGHRSQRQSGPDRRSGDDVVPAGVPDIGQGVVFRAYGDDEIPVARAGLERRRQLVRRPGAPRGPRPQRLGHGAGRRRLIEAQLGGRVDRMAQ